MNNTPMSCLSRPANTTAKENNKQAVILLHGLVRSPLSMLRIAHALKHAGFSVHNWRYNTLDPGGIVKMTETLRPRLASLQHYETVHAVGHSLGGLILRGLLSNQDATGTPPPTPHALPLGRIVFLGTPHKGAQVVNRNTFLFGHKYTPRIIHELRAGSPVINSLGLPDMEIGVIAGVEKFNVINPVSWLNRKILGDTRHDGTVEIDSARLDHMDDYLEVPVNHSLLPLSGQVTRAITHYIQEGTFL